MPRAGLRPPRGRAPAPRGFLRAVEPWAGSTTQASSLLKSRHETQATATASSAVHPPSRLVCCLSPACSCYRPVTYFWPSSQSLRSYERVISELSDMAAAPALASSWVSAGPFKRARVSQHRIVTSQSGSPQATAPLAKGSQSSQQPAEPRQGLQSSRPASNLSTQTSPEIWHELLGADEDEPFNARARSASDAAMLRRKGHLKEQDFLIEFLLRMHETHTCQVGNPIFIAVPLSICIA